MTEKNTYSQREWDRTVGWGQVPEEYKTPEVENEHDESEDFEGDFIKSMKQSKKD